jgi:GalNAc-alpha-(1->4)-GalNAc-alpha-(1->3)-diNAcBac-PP-undecaprenol alpha-1,4-N-acetyl-D-galactosaminyltransferase
MDSMTKSAHRGISIACVIPGNKVGGTERVATTLASEWARNGNRVTLIETSNESGPGFFSLEESVRSVRLGLGGESTGIVNAIYKNIIRIGRLRTELRKSRPDIVVSFLTEQNVTTILSAIGLKSGLLVSERTDPYSARKSFIWRLARWTTYRYADRVVVLNERAKRFFKRFSEPVVVPNPVHVPYRLSRNPRQRKIVGMGRLVESKRFDLLVRAFGMVAIEHPSWRLVILGDGPLKEQLERTATQAGTTERVSLPGSVGHPEGELKDASIFVSCSVLEGFPMAVCEAMANGLAVVVARYNESVQEIVEDGWNGLLVPAGDRRATEQAIRRLIEDECLRSSLGARARETMKRFDICNVLEEWNQLFSEVVAGNGGGPRNHKDGSYERVRG